MVARFAVASKICLEEKREGSTGTVLEVYGSKTLNRRKRQFARIAEAEYGKALAAGPPLVPARAVLEEKGSNRIEHSLANRDTRLIAAFAAGFLAAGVIRLRRNRVK